MKPLIVSRALSLLEGLAGDETRSVLLDEEALWRYLVQRAREHFGEKLRTALIAEEFAKQVGVPLDDCRAAVEQLLRERSVPKGKELMRIGSSYKALSRD